MSHSCLDRPLLTYSIQVGNPSVSALYEDALVYETGSAITSTGALTAYSGAKTGRSPLDKRIVQEEGSEKDVWWGPVNKPMSPYVSRANPSHVPRRRLRHLLWPSLLRTTTSSSSLPRNQRSREKCSVLPCFPASRADPDPMLQLGGPLLTDDDCPGMEDQS